MTTPSARTAQTRKRHPVWVALLLGGSGTLIVLAATVNPLFFAAAGLAAVAADAAWIGLSADEFLDTIDDTTAPPVGPT